MTEIWQNPKVEREYKKAEISLIVHLRLKGVIVPIIIMLRTPSTKVSQNSRHNLERPTKTNAQKIYDIRSKYFHKLKQSVSYQTVNKANMAALS